MKDQPPTTPKPNTKKATYIAPKVTVTEIRIEQGFQLSGHQAHYGMTESIQEGGCIDFGDPNPYYPDGEPMLEGISNGQTILF